MKALVILFALAGCAHGTWQNYHEISTTPDVWLVTETHTEPLVGSATHQWMLWHCYTLQSDKTVCSKAGFVDTAGRATVP